MITGNSIVTAAKKAKGGIDWALFLFILPITAAGLATMNSLGNRDYYFNRQVILILLSALIFFVFSFIDWSFLRKGEILVVFLLGIVLVLLGLLILGKTVKGAASWIKMPFFSIEPAELAKLVLILVLAKYFSRRHIEIANIKHIFMSVVYVAMPLIPIFFQPDFGSALIVAMIWLGMIMVSGINKKHLFLVFAAASLSFALCWLFVFKPYQKDRVLTFLNPLRDSQRAGYNARQSVIAVGSGEIWGKGIGFGTQSRLEFLPEHQTDFIFAAFAEEWGLAGAFLIFLFYGLVVWRVIKNSMLGQTNFEVLFGLGMAVFLMSQFILNVGMNIGLLPITGVGLPFMSYGGSNLMTIFAGLGIFMGMRRYSRSVHPEDASAEFLGPR